MATRRVTWGRATYGVPVSWLRLGQLPEAEMARLKDVCVGVCRKLVLEAQRRMNMSCLRDPFGDSLKTRRTSCMQDDRSIMVKGEFPLFR